MKVVTEILQDLEILKRLLKHNANLKIRINYYLTIPLAGFSNIKVYGHGKQMQQYRVTCNTKTEYTRSPLTGSLANTEDQDEMPENVAFHQSLHYLLR